MMRLVQLQHGPTRRVALVDEPHLKVLAGVASVYQLAALADETRLLTKIIGERNIEETLDYDAIYSGETQWQLLPPIDHPDEPARCLVSGTGLTHLGSAKNRQAMHGANEAEMNDSMKMFRWGVEGGKTAPGKIGVAPEWFYKGSGSVLRAHGQPLEVPPFGEDGGEEGEIAGLYMIGLDGRPLRVGMAAGNEFSDHKFEKKNYLNLAGSKLRTCSLGPELVIAPKFDSIAGKVTLRRDGQTLWSREILTGENEMCHSLANIEHHHFKFDEHRRPGDVHVHYFGACSLSFGDGIVLADGDVMEISFAGFGRPLRNPMQTPRDKGKLVTVRPLS